MKKPAVIAILLMFALPARGAVVFMYHRFGEGEYPSTNVTLEQFEAHLDFLEREGFEVWPLPKLVTHLKQREPVPDKVIAITVDDAYLSVYENAFPLLREHSLPFTVFVATDPVDQRLGGYMSWDQLRELHAAGVTLANHSASHESLIRRAGETADDWRERVQSEIVRAQARLQSEIGADVNETPRLFAWPFGEFEAALAEMLAQMGYVAFGQHSGALGPHDDPRALPRFPVNKRYGVMEDFALKARTLPFPVLEVEPWNPVVADSDAPALRLQLGDSGANLNRLSCYFGGETMGVTWLDREARLFSISTSAPLPAGRSRYNCTAPHRSADRWYWYSHPWIRR